MEEGALLKWGEVDHPREVMMSKRRRCLSEEPETTKGGAKSMEAILCGGGIVSVSMSKFD